MYPHSFSTILEVNYDTPYDRHIIIEESHDIRKRKSRARLEEGEGATFGSRVLKYDSSYGYNYLSDKEWNLFFNWCWHFLESGAFFGYGN